ncbi:hypothetical protein [Cyanobium sp. NIES-981]|uniref:hypothetical protein n=1 Tax=Cyanobium sp. NIES-981 TaxID=1851505 RepID=UPI00156077E7|nr:hypothetical protein [Cyanobium sp. NIES-981]
MASARVGLPGFSSIRALITISGRFQYSGGDLSGGVVSALGYRLDRLGSFSIRGLQLGVAELARLGGSVSGVQALWRRMIEGDDTIIGSRQSDWLLGSAGDDLILGGPGNDLINAGTGFNRVTGGLGADTFAFQMGAGFTEVTDFRPGVDRLSLAGLGRVTSRRQGSTWQLFSGADLVAEFRGTPTDPLAA